MNRSWPSWILPAVFVLLAAASRFPGLFPPNFSAFYGLAFCAGAFFPSRTAWWLPMGTLLVTDLLLDCYYQFALGIDAFQAYQLINYAVFALLILLGRRFRGHRNWLGLLAGGLLGACLFYLITNTAAWLFNPFANPEYTRDLAGWIAALTHGTGGHPPTWEFFRNTLASGGLFTGLFAAALLAATRPESETQPSEESEAAPDAEAGESPATPESAALPDSPSALAATR